MKRCCIEPPADVNLASIGGQPLCTTVLPVSLSSQSTINTIAPTTALLIGGKATTAAPTYANNTMNPLSLTNDGALRTSVVSIGGGLATEVTLQAINTKLQFGPHPITNSIASTLPSEATGDAARAVTEPVMMVGGICNAMDPAYDDGNAFPVSITAEGKVRVQVSGKYNAVQPVVADEASSELQVSNNGRLLTTPLGLSLSFFSDPPADATAAVTPVLLIQTIDNGLTMTSGTSTYSVPTNSTLVITDLCVTYFPVITGPSIVPGTVSVTLRTPVNPIQTWYVGCGSSVAVIATVKLIDGGSVIIKGGQDLEFAVQGFDETITTAQAAGRIHLSITGHLLGNA